MDSNRIEGTARDMAGRVQENVGGMMGDARMQARGAARQGYGQAQDAVGQLGDAVREQPMMAALIALGIGFILGRITG